MSPGVGAWSSSLHQTFRLLPNPTANLKIFLEADGASPDEVLRKLPYDKSRSRKAGSTGPDPKRYRDSKQVYQTIGLLFQDEDGKVRVTDLGKATLRWLDLINQNNFVLLGRHAAYALAACQLRNPTGSGLRYGPEIEVFPFSFIWQAMVELDGKINSDELNRGLFKVKNRAELGECISKIRKARNAADIELLGPETVSGKGKDDRIIPWMSLASFGWTILTDKRETGFYQISPAAHKLVLEASRIRHKHMNFESTGRYVEYLSYCAALPKDLR